MAGESKLGLQGDVTPRVTLIDEDLSFSKEMVGAARRNRTILECRNNVKEVYQNPPQQSDVLVLGYDLTRVDGVQLSQYLEKHANAHLVVIVIKGSLEKLIRKLPPSVKAVISKDAGPDHILGVVRLLFRTYRVNR